MKMKDASLGGRRDVASAHVVEVGTPRRPELDLLHEGQELPYLCLS